MPLKNMKNSDFFTEPPRSKNILPQQCCPAFTPREGAMPEERECWFCQYAEFHIEKAQVLDVGTCEYPTKRKWCRKVK